MVNSVCNRCNTENHTEIMVEWARDGITPVICSRCSSVYMVEVNINDELESEEISVGNTDEDDIIDTPVTVIPIGEEISIDNKDHPQHDKHGIIINKDNFHYRIEFIDGPLENQKVWIPYSWVKKKEKRP